MAEQLIPYHPEDTPFDTEEEQSEAFGWIRMDLHCPGHTHTEWLSLETM